MTVKNLVADWNGPVCWSDFERSSYDFDAAAMEIADDLFAPWQDNWTFFVQCCVKSGPVIPTLYDEVIEWIDNDEENSLASGDGLIAANTTSQQREALQLLIEAWAKSLNVSMNRWAPGEPEMDVTALVKQYFHQNYR